MKAVLPLFVFVDACGWEIIKNDPFARALAPNRKRLESVFGITESSTLGYGSGRRPAFASLSEFMQEFDHEVPGAASRYAQSAADCFVKRVG